MKNLVRNNVYRRNIGNIIRKPEITYLQLTDCEVLADIDILSCTKSLDSTNKIDKDYSIQLVKTADVANYFTATLTKAVDFSKYRDFIFSFYTANKSNIATVSIVLFTTSPFDYGSCYTKFIAVADMANGWNIFRNPIIESASDFVKAGVNDFSTVEGIRITVNIVVDNATETVNIDRFYLKKW